MPSLAETSHEHHDRLIRHVERLHALAEMVDVDTTFALRAGLDEESRFIEEQLLPHMQAIETTLYGQLERLMGGRHSMDGLRTEQRVADRLGDIAVLDGFERRLHGAHSMGSRVTPTQRPVRALAAIASPTSIASWPSTKVG